MAARRFTRGVRTSRPARRHSARPHSKRACLGSQSWA
jgi:hypothetical protein